MLDKNWQRLVLTHLEEKQHLGVLTGAPLTDVKITLLTGKAHLKHTEGGDFRQATYRAVRQGLRMAEAKDGVQLLEPWYDFTLELPADALVVMLRRGSENVIPNGDTAIQAGDLMVLSTPLYEDDDGVSLREVPVAEHGDWIGRPIKELGIPAEVLIVLVRRADGTTVVPKGGTVLQQGDMLVVNEWEET